MSQPGPMPLAQARATLAGVDAFTRERGDELWAALLSLEDAAELVAVASRLRWEFHPRGFDNVDLHARYGDGIVPWLATRLDEGGVLHNQPWCVVPCLLACGSAEAFALVWRVAGSRAARLGRRRRSRSAGGVERTRHPAVARAELASRSARRAAGAGPPARGRGPQAPERAADVLALLDACAARLFPTRSGWRRRPRSTPCAWSQPAPATTGAGARSGSTARGRQGCSRRGPQGWPTARACAARSTAWR
ncbi:MAG: hypothetical protein HS111_25670 [Kofleriaceae bacterium]|nr:hypothetical protein [Kofleriaceae bacterium]